jgi:WD40 repeat protein
MFAAVRRWFTLVAMGVTLSCLAADPPVKPEPAKPALDLYGDPLPQGAIARLGSVRFRHPWFVDEVTFSEDGKLLAASGPGGLIIWDRATGRKLHHIPGDREHGPRAPRFSPDGKRLYYEDKTLCAWDLDKGAAVKDFQIPPAETRSIGYSPNGREVILLHKEEEIVRWDLEKGKELARYPKPKDDNFAHFALVGERLLVPEFDGKSVSVRDAAEKKQLWSVEATKYDNGRALSMCFSADGKLFAVETPQNVISLYDSVSGKLIRRFKSDVTGVYWSVHISPDMKTVAASNWDGTLRLWDLETGKERVKISTIEGWTTYVYFAPDSKTFATGGPNTAHGVLLWETSTGKRIEPFPGHSSRVNSVSFSPDGSTVATSSYYEDAVVRLWEPQSGKLLRSLVSDTSHGVEAVAISPNGATLAAGSCRYGDGKLRLWDYRTGRELHAVVGHESECHCVAFSPDGKRLVSGDDYINPKNNHFEGNLYIWDVEAGKLLRVIRGTSGAIQRVLFTRDGRQVVAAADAINIYDAETGERVGEPFQTGNRIWNLVLSADGRLLATADEQGPVRLWELATRREITLPLPNSKSRYVALTTDGRTLAAEVDGDVHLYHWPSEKFVGKLASDDVRLDGVFFSPDNRRLATPTDRDGSVLIWDVAKMVNTPLPAVTKPTEKELQRWWQELRDDDPGTAYKAVWRFAATPEQSLPFLAASLHPAKAADSAVIAGLIDDLDNNDFKVREAASLKLAQMGDPVMEPLRKKAAEGKPSVEQADRIKKLLAKLVVAVAGPEQLQTTRALAVLEQIGGPEAKKIFASLADGAPGATLTREAKAALERLKRGEK